MLIIFDFDGTLMKEDWEGLFEAYKAIIKSQNKDYRIFFKNLEEFKKWWSPDWRKNDQKLELSDIDIPKAHKIFYETHHLYIGLFPWVNSVIPILAGKHRLAILTNRHRKSAQNYLGRLEKYFKLVIGGEDVKKLKPNPEGIKIILKETCVNQDETLIIGDMPDDILAGKAAGIKVGVVKWGLADWDELMAYLPDYSFEEYEHLLQI